MIDYFTPAPTVAEATLRRIKGNYRRDQVLSGIESDGLNSVPEAWKDHDISDTLKNFLGRQHPHARGGEDLPDLEEGEVEIARLTLLNSVHGEVTSLRARRGSGQDQILFRMVDEYESEIKLPNDNGNTALTAEQVICFFRDADPSPTKIGCEIGFQSFFYPNLDQLARQIGVK